MGRVCRAEAPAKVILLGEHWVVHGGLALAAAVSLYARVVCEETGGAEVIVESRELGVRERVYPLGGCRRLCGLGRSVEVLAAGSVAGARCRIESEIPVGAGLGSSAAVAVAFAAAYSCLLGRFDVEAVNAAAYESEKLVHGRPSGVDNTAAARGGFILYRRGEAPRSVEARWTPRILVVDTGVSRSTRRAVERFTRFLRSLGPLGDELLALNDRVVREALEALRSRDRKKLGSLMYLAHGMLNAMGVSHPVLEDIVQLARAMGAAGAKLSGAGMGGAAIVLEPGGELEEALRRRGYRVYSVKLGVPGVRVEGL